MDDSIKPADKWFAKQAKLVIPELEKVKREHFEQLKRDKQEASWDKLLEPFQCTK